MLSLDGAMVASLPPDRIQPPLIGDPAPMFTARSTMGELSLESYRGRWVLFLSHPADFTPVCTSEIMGFARLHPQFQALECDILALSVDSLYAHLAWVQMISDRHGVDVPFPLVEDPTMAIARAYGMIHAESRDSATVRASIVIDPAGIVRATTCYPLIAGRNAAEHLRLVTALREADRTGGLAPENWQPEDPMLRPPPTSVAELAGDPSGSGWLLRSMKPGKRPSARRT
ncbi:peroxiredoxin [Falsiroseomonas sp.]|uniref:peroxiredoxin n=1 Tax=Falsiroseomonas sp. TaxID=2870721 RepID=UPI0034A582C1